MEKPKRRMAVEALVASALVVGAVSADARHHKGERPRVVKVESKEDHLEDKHKSILSETRELINQIPTEALDRWRRKGESDNVVKRRLQRKLLIAIQFSDSLVARHRFKNEDREADYFEACYDKENWKEIKTYAAKASEKTGVPQDLLISIGFIESRFKPSLSRKDTKVYGPLQMTLDTGKKAAKESETIYGKEIIVDGPEDLMTIKNGLMLAAIHLKNLEAKYGQWGLAVVAYSSGEGSLEKKINSEFPDVDIGASDRSQMRTAFESATKAKKTVTKLLLVKKSGNLIKQQVVALEKARAELTEARTKYRELEKLWRDKLAKMPETLRKSGVNVFTLFDEFQSRGDNLPHSLTYPLALDSISQKANIHAEKSGG